MDYTHDRDVVIAKIIAGSVLFGVSVICGIIPFKLAQIFKWTEPIDPNSKSDKKSAKVVSGLLCFGGGVLLATTFLHLLPEVGNEVKRLTETGELPDAGLHLAEIFMMTGFFLIYLIEEIIHHYLHRYQNQLKTKSEQSLSTMKPEEENFAEALMRGIAARNSVHRRFSDVNGCVHSSHSQRGSTIDLSNTHDTKTVLSVNEKGQHSMPINDIQQINQMNHGHGHSHALPLPHSNEEDFLVSSLRGLLIVFALSTHELFEGFAVGLEKTEHGVYYLFAAVCGHKFVISFCIGVELMVQRTRLWLAFFYVMVYSIVTVIGILVGAIMTTGSNGEQLAVPNVVMQGFATGTLLYVIFFEILSKDRSGMVPYLSVLSGCVLMAFIQYIAGITEGQTQMTMDTSTISSLESF